MCYTINYGPLFESIISVPLVLNVRVLFERISFVSFISEMILTFVRNDFIKSMEFCIEVPIYAIALAEFF